jgi:CheY-like chemotaxis protein
VPPAHPATVLVVDDFDAVRAMLRKQLTDRGHHVLEAGNGIEALQLVRRCGGKVDLILADVVMPGMNGTQLADRLTTEFPGLPVILMSAFAPAGLARVGLRDVVIPVLQKPFDPAQLDDLLRTALRSDHPAPRLTAASDT